MKSHVAAAAAADPAGSTVRLLTVPAAASRDSTASRLLLLLLLLGGSTAAASTLTAGVRRCCLIGLAALNAACLCSRIRIQTNEVVSCVQWIVDACGLFAALWQRRLLIGCVCG
jgi:hypothetical protein